MYLDFPVPSAHFLRILPAWKITLCSGHLFWGVSHIVPTEAFMACLQNRVRHYMARILLIHRKHKTIDQ